MNGIVTLLTDYGTADGYAGEVKGALLRAAPGLTLVDITHDIAPGDVAAAAWVLGRTWRSFPEGTTHFAVVDPGVGTARRALGAVAGGHAFVAPDNGLLSLVAGAAALEAVELGPPEGASATFHGRDVFAPAAARLALGAPHQILGRPVSDLVLMARPVLRREGKKLIGCVMHVDRFGTLVTNLAPGDLPRTPRIQAGGRDVPLRMTFGDVPAGTLVAFVGSAGTLEIAVRDGRADVQLGLGRGDEITVES